jgi:hypothetical protein
MVLLQLEVTRFNQLGHLVWTLEEVVEMGVLEEIVLGSFLLHQQPAYLQ